MKLDNNKTIARAIKRLRTFDSMCLYSKRRLTQNSSILVPTIIYSRENIIAQQNRKCQNMPPTAVGRLGDKGKSGPL